MYYLCGLLLVQLTPQPPPTPTSVPPSDLLLTPNVSLSPSCLLGRNLTRPSSLHLNNTSYMKSSLSSLDGMGWHEFRMHEIKTQEVRSGGDSLIQSNSASIVYTRHLPSLNFSFLIRKMEI